MKLHFLGANRQVTGSRYVLDVAGKQIMIDCGLFQERPYEGRNWSPCPVGAGNIDVMLLTHAHIDHSGLIPRLIALGFRGPVYCTRATAALLEIMLPDSAHVQESESTWQNRRKHRAGRYAKEDLAPL